MATAVEELVERQQIEELEQILRQIRYHREIIVTACRHNDYSTIMRECRIIENLLNRADLIGISFDNFNCPPDEFIR